MQSSPNQQNQTDAAHLTTVRSILWHAIDFNVTTRKALAVAADSSEEMVGRVLAGQAPKLMVFRRWVSTGSPLPKALKDMLMTWFCRSSDYAAVGRGVFEGEEVLDRNGDGVIDARDVLALKIDAMSKGAEAMGYLSEAMLDGKLDGAEAGKVRSLFNEVVTLVQRAGEALDYRGDKGHSPMRVA